MFEHMRNPLINICAKINIIVMIIIIELRLSLRFMFVCVRV